MTLVEDMTFEQAYAFMDQWVIEALGGLGIKVWYQPLNDITSSAGKIAGAAQTRRRGPVLHHVTMADDIDPVRMLQLLPIGRENLSEMGPTRPVPHVDTISHQNGPHSRASYRKEMCRLEESVVTHK